ncbi:MAG: hypothetical protein WCG79_05030 [Verrucomicrobiota bacterium]|jgi:hypothetical protein
MRPLLYIIFLAGLLTSAKAGVFDQIDAHKRADVNGQTVALPTIRFDTVPQTILPMTVAPVSGKAVDRNQTFATKNVAFDTLNFPIVPSKTLPMTNFTTKRAALDKPLIETGAVPTGTVSTDKAKINSRVIRPLTPDGHQELKDQINKIP